MKSNGEIYLKLIIFLITSALASLLIDPLEENILLKLRVTIHGGK